MMAAIRRLGTAFFAVSMSAGLKFPSMLIISKSATMQLGVAPSSLNGSSSRSNWTGFAARSCVSDET